MRSAKVETKTAQRLNELAATEIARGVAAGEFSAEAVVRDCIERIAVREPTIHAFANIDPELALRQARELDRGPIRGALHGVPIGVKDVIDTADLPTERDRRSSRPSRRLRRRLRVAPRAPPARSFGARR
jgi:Asp-tRNA(Asn)/Glu-tRNA(Gln) amidotransferase A subunit family amidase